MLILLVAILGATFFWICLAVTDNKESGRACGLFIGGGAFSFAILLMGASLLAERGGVESKIEHYGQVKWQIGKIGKIHVNDVPVIQKAISFNQMIENYRKNKDSVWIGSWYASEIAALEPIKLPEGGD